VVGAGVVIAVDLFLYFSSLLRRIARAWHRPRLARRSTRRQSETALRANAGEVIDVRFEIK